MMRKVIKAINEILKRWAKALKALYPGEKGSHALKKKAIAYSSDILLGRTGEVISRAYQKTFISQFAEENNIEVMAWFEDEMYAEDLMTRPGIQKMLAYKKPYDIFLVERVWVLSRKMPVLEVFLKVLAQKKITLHTATYLWDCTSQMARRLLAGKAIVPAKVVEPVMAAKAFWKVTFQRPEKFRFGHAFDPQPAK